MNKRLFCLAASFLAPLGASSCAQAQPCGIEALFGGRGVASAAFYACEQGDSFESACSSPYKKSHLVFK